MQQDIVDHPECVAWALALLTAADACVGRCEIDRLEELDAFRSIGVSRARFLEIAHTCRDEIGENLIGLSWLPADDLERIDRILDAVRDPQLRLLVCRLATASITADGCISDAEHRVFNHMLGHWHVHRSMVSEAIRSDSMN